MDCEYNKHIRKVCILFPYNIGDVVLFSGVLKFIRDIYPNSHITIILKKHISNLLENFPHIDMIYSWEDVSGYKWRQLIPLPLAWRVPAIISRLLSIYKYQYDLLLVPVRSPNAGFFNVHGVAKYINATIKIGIKGDLSNQSQHEDKDADAIYTKRLDISSEDVRTHEMIINKKFSEFLKGSEISDSDIWPEFWTDKEDLLFAQKRIEGTADEIIIGCFASAVADIRNWPHDNFLSLFQLLSNYLNFRLVFFGANKNSREELKLIEKLKHSGYQKQLIDLRGQTTLRQLVECVRLCDILIGVESGGIHIATALTKPTVVLMGGGHFGRFYPWGNPKINRICFTYYPCYWCNWHCSQNTANCLQEINQEMVCTEVRLALRNSGYNIEVNKNEIVDSLSRTKFIIDYLGNISPWVVKARQDLL